MPSHSQIPPIRGFQFDTTAVSGVQSSVNLFRGDVNLTQPLFTMPGRGQDQALDVNVCLLYQSNVTQQATTWNQDAPTSIVGLGWTLPVSSISLDAGASLAARTYSYSGNGGSGALIREPDTPFLFSVPAAVVGSPAAGQPVPSDLVAAFGAMGLALSAESVFAPDTRAADPRAGAGDGWWRIDDAPNQQQFSLRPDGDAWRVHDGGESYQLHSYDFSKILYYPAWERWAVTDTAGTVSSYGGVDLPPQGASPDLPRASAGNSIEWGVAWHGADAVAPSWTGPSTLTTGQRQYARVWHLARIDNLWGDSVHYAYNQQWPRDPQTGVAPVVEQRVQQPGQPGGLPYTKACYLTSVTDVFGRTASFEYASKLWNSAAESPREYADPHKEVPDDTPNAWQDRYETQYLQRIVVRDLDQRPLLRVVLQYDPSPGAGDSSAVANVTSTTGTLRGDTYKRYLTGIQLENGAGDARPATIFSYYLDQQAENQNEYSPGALRSMTTPEGATSTWGYTAQSLPLCERSQQVTPPAAFGAGVSITPRVWFGSDYAVATWYDQTQGRLSLQIWSWYGRWISWEPSWGPLLWSDRYGLDPSTLEVATSDAFIALSFIGGAARTRQVFVFDRDSTRPGVWTPATIDGVTTAYNTPCLDYGTGFGDVSLIPGSSFFLVAKTAGGPSSYDRVTWRWTTRAWTRETIPLDGFAWITAQGEYYLVLDTGGRARVTALEPTLAWRERGSIQIPDALASTPASDLVLVPGSSMVVASVLGSRPGDSTLRYTLYPMRWDAAYQFASAVAPRFAYADSVDSSGDPSSPATWVPTLVDDTLIACAAHLLRYNGADWLANDALQVHEVAGISQRYAYGPDYAIRMSVNSTGTSTAALLPFDANIDWAGWAATRAATPAAGPLLSESWPTAGNGDYLSIGQYLYARGTATNWATVVTSTTPSNMQALINAGDPGAQATLDLDTDSVINQGPAFLAFNATRRATGTAAETAIILLKNGQPATSPAPLTGQWLSSASQPDAAMPGVAPAGAQTLATYPASSQDFTTATSFTLHRFAGNDVSGNIVHYAVTSFTADDGMGEGASRVTTTITPLPGQAACDPTGTVVKYYQTIVSPAASSATAPGPEPGVAPPDAPRFGTIAVTYLNGLGDDELAGDDYYGMMDGLLRSVDIRDAQGRSVSTTTLAWKAYARRAPDPSSAEVPAVNLGGAFVVRAGITRTSDGVTTRSESSYVDHARGFDAPWSSAPVSQTTSGLGSTGTRETTTTRTAYGCQFASGASLRALNILSRAVQTLQLWTPEGGAPVPAQVSATPWSSWPSARAEGVLVPAAEASFAWLGGAPVDFPFDAYTAGDTPEGWQLARGRVTHRTLQGLVSEGVDACGVVSSVRYQGSETLPVAQVTNASLAAWTYLGFEPYESTADRTLDGTDIAAGDAYTGSRSLALPAGKTSSLRASVTVAAGQGALDASDTPTTYVLGYASKTAPGYAAQPGDGWTIDVSWPGGAAAPQQVPFADTRGTWRFSTAGIPVPAGAGPFTITATATSAGSDTVLLDTVYLAPLVSELSAQTFDAGTRLPTSALINRGRQSRTAYDAFAQPVASTAGDGNILALSQSFLSRQGNRADTFDPAYPNATLGLSPADGGHLDTFTEGSEWQSRWQASSLDTSWQVVDGVLVHTATTADTLTWRGWPGATPDTAALYFELVIGPASGSVSESASGPTADAPLADEVAIRFGAADGGSPWTLAWAPANGGQWQLRAPDGTITAPLGAPPRCARQWLLVFGRGVLLFFGDGQLLFSVPVGRDDAQDLLSSVALATGENRLGVRNLAMTRGPRVDLSLLDGAARDRQTQSLHGADAILSASLCDVLGRTVAITKPAPARFGQDADLPLLAYHPRFADRDAFLASMASSWILDGDVSDYYRGQVEDGIPRSDDQGYPYTGCRYEDSVRRRRVESGMPGRTYAIHDVDTTTPTERLTTQMAYGTNPAVGTIPAGSYHTRSITSPLKSVTAQVMDVARQTIETTSADEDGVQTGKTHTIQTWTSQPEAAWSTETVQLPNYFTAAPQTGAAGFTRTTRTNPLGLAVSATGPDTGTTAAIYDPAGRARFVQPALDPGALGFLYCKYDALGRLTEQGTVPQPWDPSVLQPLADDPAMAGWPGADVAHTVARTCRYDGDGNDPRNIGQRLEVTTITAAPTALVPDARPITTTETATYDARGRVGSLTLCLSLPSAPVSTVRYAYNNLSDLTAVTYPAGSPVARVIYTFDDLGRIVAIGSAPDDLDGSPDDYAAYTYTPAGGTRTASLGKGALRTTYQVDSPDWLLAQTTTARGADAPCLTLTYAYRADAAVIASSEILDFPEDRGTRSLTYAYSSQRRLLSATVADGGPGSDQVTSYDANGNIWALSADGVDARFTSAPGQDRLQTVTLGNGAPVSPVYGAAGRMLACGPLRAAYDANLSRPSGFALSGQRPAALQLAYTGQGLRSAKLVTGTGALTQLYVCGIGTRPLAIQRDGTWTAFVYGPTGVVSVVRDARYIALADQQKTVRALVDQADGSLAARYVYRAFGAPLEASGPAAELTPYRFMGQEWDRETGLYNFVARTYDPVLCRFHEPDPAGQFASPYVFVGNDPISMIDTDGARSQWATVASIGIGVAMATVAVAGVLGTVVTGGASDGVATELEMDLLAADEIVDDVDGTMQGVNLVDNGMGDGAPGSSNGAQPVQAGVNPRVPEGQVAPHDAGEPGWQALDSDRASPVWQKDPSGANANRGGMFRKPVRGRTFEAASTAGDDGNWITKIGTSKQIGKGGRNASRSAAIVERLRRYGITMPADTLAGKHELGNCGMQRALAKLGRALGDGDNVLQGRDIRVSYGGYRGGLVNGGWTRYVTPCQNCSRIGELNQNIQFVLPSPGVDVEAYARGPSAVKDLRNP